jgi:uncharacterized protein (DUF934 family)
MLLLDRQGAKADQWTRVQTIEDASGDSVLAPYALLEQIVASRRHGQRIGVYIENTVRADALRPFLDQLALIVIAFPAGTNGRGFSIARQLRTLGYQGALRASGPLFSDQFPHALACGFDEVELPDENAARQPAAQWIAAAQRMSVSYQPGYVQGSVTNILDQRRRARLAGETKNV